MILQNPSNGVNVPVEEKPKVVVLMGPTASGKSKLAIDLATYFPIEIINADSYHSLDVLTNKVPSHERKAKEFLDSAIPALVSPFLLDDNMEDLYESLQNDPIGDELRDHISEFGGNSANRYDYLKNLDPVAANRIHPNNHRKINQYLNLYARSGILPSNLFQGKAAEHAAVDKSVILNLLIEGHEIW